MSDIEFAVTEEYQAKVLAYMLHNYKFCGVASSHLKPEHFTNKALQWFFNKLATSNQALTPTLLQEELIRAAKDKSIRQEEVAKFVSLYDVIKNKPAPTEEEYIREKTSTFIRTQEVKRALEDTVELAKRQEWESIVDIMQQAVLSGCDIDNMGIDYFSRVEDRISERANREKYRRLPTGIPELDELTYGGIKNTQVGLIVGGTGRGKSIFLQWLARVAVLLNKKVVYFTHELSEADVEDRFDSMLAKVRPHELNEYQQDVLNTIGKYKETYGSSLIIKHYPADSATVHTLKGFIQQLSHAGIRPDLVLIDYLDLLKPHRQYNSQHEETDAVTKALVGFAAEYDISIWTATQLNRSGLVMETPDEASMAGYIGKQYHVDMVLWMAQTKEEKEDEIMRLWISKNRNGPAGRTIELDTNYGYMEFYREKISTESTDDNTFDVNDNDEVLID